jgi:S1-C subfamily serine protease
MKSLLQIIFLGLVVLFLASIFSTSDEVVLDVDQKDDPVVLEEEIVDIIETVPEEVVEIEVTPEQIPIVEEYAEVVAEILEPLDEAQDEEAKDLSFEALAKEEEIPQISFSTINEVTREALVNIFCTTQSGGSFKPATGSGVVIDERGIILTNAHVAQYFLLKDYLTEDFISCVIRTGSPATPLYTARPVFISPSWVKANANGIIQQEPKGTGEDDYALLFITGRTDSTKTIPETFPFVSPLYNSGNIATGDNVLLAAYPAGFLSGIAISRDLYISSAVTQIVEVFTFKDGTLDLFSIGGSVVAQQGSSGGAVVNDKNELLGIIVTSTTADTTAERDLRAITIAHINRSFMKDTGSDLQTLFSGNMEAEVNAFDENIAPALTQLLVDELEK